MITILFGPGGSGKSFYQLHLVVEKLRFGRQNISTNLAINVPRFCEYLEERYPNENLNVVGRLRILTEDETKTFWKFRGPYLYQGSMAMGEAKLIENKGEFGCVFIVDEAGAAGFNAQGWAAGDSRTPRGVECTWYLDQQRKFGDDVIASANGRTPNAIAKGFRDKAHEFVKMKNGYLKSMGMFKAVGKFTAVHYATEPDKNTEPLKSPEFKLDVAGLASCYRTADGVGVSGGVADIGRKAKGLDVRFIVPMGIAAGIIFIVAIKFGAGMFGGGKPSLSVVDSVAASSAEVITAGSTPKAQAAAAAQVTLPEVTVVGYAFTRGLPVVWLSDGSTHRGYDVKRIDADAVVLATGEVFKFTPKVKHDPPPQRMAALQ